MLEESKVKEVEMENREIFDWGMQKVGHKTADLVNSFVTSAIIQEDMQVEDKPKEESNLMVQNQVTSKFVSEVSVKIN